MIFFKHVRSILDSERSDKGYGQLLVFHFFCKLFVGYKFRFILILSTVKDFHRVEFVIWILLYTTISNRLSRKYSLNFYKILWVPGNYTTAEYTLDVVFKTRMALPGTRRNAKFLPGVWPHTFTRPILGHRQTLITRIRKHKKHVWINWFINSKVWLQQPANVQFDQKLGFHGRFRQINYWKNRFIISKDISKLITLSRRWWMRIYWTRPVVQVDPEKFSTNNQYPFCIRAFLLGQHSVPGVWYNNNYLPG